jgi:hypothetical protein
MFHKGYDCCNVAVLKKAFDAFDREKSGSISTNMVEEILRLMGQPFNRNTLEELIDEVDADSKYTQNTPLLGSARMLSREAGGGPCHVRYQSRSCVVCVGLNGNRTDFFSEYSTISVIRPALVRHVQ